MSIRRMNESFDKKFKEDYAPVEEVKEGYELLDGTKVELYKDYNKASARAKELGLKEAEYGDAYGVSYCMWNTSGDRNEDEEVIAYYKFEGRKPRPLTDDEAERIARDIGVQFEDFDESLKEAYLPDSCYDGVRDWYVAEFPDDELGAEIHDITFEDIVRTINIGMDVYEFIPHDSVVRERIFAELAKRLGVDYQKVYDAWLSGSRNGYAHLKAKRKRTATKPVESCKEANKSELQERKNTSPKGKESAKVRDLIDVIDAPQGLAKKNGYKLSPDKLSINGGGQFNVTKTQYNRLKELGYGKDECLKEDSGRIIKFNYSNGGEHFVGYTVQDELDKIDKQNDYFWFTDDKSDIKNGQVLHGWTLPAYLIDKVKDERVMHIIANESKLKEGKRGFVRKYKGCSIHDAGDVFVCTNEHGLNIGQSRTESGCEGLIDEYIKNKGAKNESKLSERNLTKADESLKESKNSYDADKLQNMLSNATKDKLTKANIDTSSLEVSINSPFAKEAYISYNKDVANYQKAKSGEWVIHGGHSKFPDSLAKSVLNDVCRSLNKYTNESLKEAKTNSKLLFKNLSGSLWKSTDRFGNTELLVVDDKKGKVVKHLSDYEYTGKKYGDLIDTYVDKEEVGESLKESQSQEIAYYYRQLKDKNGFDVSRLANEFYKTPEWKEIGFQGDVLFTEKGWNAFKKWAKETKNVDIKDLGSSDDFLGEGRLNEKQWRYTLKNGKALRDAIETEDYIAILATIQLCYQELNDAGIIDDDDCSDWVEEIDYLNVDEMDDDDIDYWLDQLYDVCDNLDVWIPLNEEKCDEDTVKQGNYWVNKGKEGTHGKFKTKKEADAQRAAMYARGFKG